MGQNRTKTFTLANTGGRASSALTVAVSGSATFAVTSDTCSGRTLGPRKACTVIVRFAPTAHGSVTATLTAVGKHRVVPASATLTGSGERLGSTLGHVYWTSTDGTINRATPAGGDMTVLAQGGTRPGLLAVDGTSVYWADTNGGTINAVPLAGGTVTTLASGQNQPQGVAVDSGHVYWTNTGGGTISSVPLTGGTVTTLFSGLSVPIGLAVDSSGLYWTNGGDGSINKGPLTGGSVTMLVDSNETQGLAVDGTHIYWTTIPSPGATISSAPLRGGDVTVLVSNQKEPLGVAVADGQIYWTDIGTASIYRVPVTGGTPTMLFGFEFSGPIGIAVGP